LGIEKYFGQKKPFGAQSKGLFWFITKKFRKSKQPFGREQVIVSNSETIKKRQTLEQPLRRYPPHIGRSL
jgi:hypothetical protein